MNHNSSRSRMPRDGLQEETISRIRDKAGKVGVVGLGQVGLPTALSFVKGGFDVIGYDINSKLVNNLSRGITTIPEHGIQDLLIEALSDGKIIFQSSLQQLANADTIIICVPTPLGPDQSADLRSLTKAVVDVSRFCLKSKTLVIIESSIPPATMSTLILPTLERISGKRLGADFLLAFCPERLSPGQALDEISDAVRVIGVSDDESFEAAKALYSYLTHAEILRSNFEAAEISKLAENAFRDVNIAFANELAIICQKYDADVKEVITIANTHPRVKILNPGPGVGGPCLPKDPYLLIHKCKEATSLIKQARSINDSMSVFLVDNLIRKLQLIFSKAGADKIKIGILGVTYKPNVNDCQNSPTERIISEFVKKGYKDITVHDPISNESFGMKSTPDLRSLLKDSDCIVISTGHELYSSLSPNDFNQSCIILDAAGILSRDQFVKSGHTRYMALGIDY